MRDIVVKKQWYLRVLRHPQIEGYRYLQNVGTNFPSHTVSCPGNQKPQISNTVSYKTINLCLSKLIFLSYEALPTSFQQPRLPARFTCDYEGNTNVRNVWNQPDSVKRYITPQTIHHTTNDTSHHKRYITPQTIRHTTNDTSHHKRYITPQMHSMKYNS